MRWILLLVGITLHVIAAGQSTLKIYVTNDDVRSDMDIIDLNTSALDRYGQSVDSTNINFYTTTMSTQVMRMSRLELFGPEEKLVEVEVVAEIEVSELVTLGGNATGSVYENDVSTVLQKKIQNPEPSSSKVSNRSDSGTYKAANRASKTKKRHGQVKKSRKMKKYRGQCPRFF